MTVFHVLLITPGVEDELVYDGSTDTSLPVSEQGSYIELTVFDWKIDCHVQFRHPSLFPQSVFPMLPSELH